MKQNIVQIVTETDDNHIVDLAEQHLFANDKQAQIRIANTSEELKAAYTLVYNQYVKRGYQAKDPTGTEVRFTPHFGLPTSHTFIASIDNEVVGTLTMVIDGALGLPMEKEYPNEILALREKGHRMAELSCLVTRRSKDLPVLLQLFHAAYAYALHQLDISDFCIAVTTEHQRFYHHALLFEQIGAAKPYESCNSVSAVAMRLHLPSAEQRYYNRHSIRRMLGRFFLGKNGLQQLGRNLNKPGKDALLARLAFTHSHLDCSNQNIMESIKSAYDLAILLLENEHSTRHALKIA